MRSKIQILVNHLWKPRGNFVTDDEAILLSALLHKRLKNKCRRKILWVSTVCCIHTFLVYRVFFFGTTEAQLIQLYRNLIMEIHTCISTKNVLMFIILVFWIIAFISIVRLINSIQTNSLIKNHKILHIFWHRMKSWTRSTSENRMKIASCGRTLSDSDKFEDWNIQQILKFESSNSPKPPKN